MSKFIEKRNTGRLPSKDIVVFYHHNCADGFGGAFAAWKKFGDKANYISFKYHDVLPKGLQGKTVYSIDISFSLEVTRQLIKESKVYVAIDHHLSGEKIVKMAKEFVYEIEDSGCVLAWRYFHPGQPVPQMLRYIEDTDLWKFKLPNSEEIFACLDLYDFDFKVWDKMIKDFENKETTRKDFIKRGKLLLRYQGKLIKRLANNDAWLVKFEGMEIPILNSPVFQSELGSLLARRYPPMAIVWFDGGDRINLSFRSVKEFDVSKIAKKFGGGGHKNACGASLPSGSKLPWKENKRKKSDE